MIVATPGGPPGGLAKLLGQNDIYNFFIQKWERNIIVASIMQQMPQMDKTECYMFII